MTGLQTSFSAVQKPRSGELIDAAKRVDATEIKDLLKRGSDVNEKDRYGNSALMFASGEGHIEIVRLLIDNNADLDIESMWGATAEKCARNRRRPEILRILQETPEIRLRAAEAKAETKSAVMEKQRKVNKMARANPIKII